MPLSGLKCPVFFHYFIDVGPADQASLRIGPENRLPDPSVELFDPRELPDAQRKAPVTSKEQIVIHDPDQILQPLQFNS
jgi:hypothetical protein